MQDLCSDQLSPYRKNLDSLVGWFRKYKSALVAFSSGVDSSVVAYAAFKALGSNAIAVTSTSQSLASEEIKEARLIAKEIGIELRLVDQDDLSDPNYVSNQVSRCYFCRSNLSSVLLPFVRKGRIEVWVDGTHVDDLKTPRPGIKALREAGFRSPLAELGFGKDEVRNMAKSAGLSNAQRPSESCLSSRIAYSQTIDDRTLRLIERSETLVRKLTRCKVVRVRTIGKKAIIEVDKESISRAKRHYREISLKLKSYGYESVEIDPEGYVSGKMLELFVRDNT